MIDNNPRRLTEFFKSPIKAGRMACLPVLSVQTILSIHAFRAIILAITTHLAWRAAPEFTPPNTGDYNTDQAMALIQDALNAFYAQPLLIALIGFVGSLAMTSVIWKIGSNYADRDLSWSEAQSGLMRFMFITAILSALLQIFQAISPSGFIALFSIGLNLYLLVLTIFIIQGIFGLKETWQALGVWFLGLIAVTGISFIVTMILALL